MLVSQLIPTPRRRRLIVEYIVQAADRALLVDTLPPAQQERGNAWAGRMLSIGSVVGFCVYAFHLFTTNPR